MRTPLVRLNVRDAPAEIYLKLENLQPIGSFKIRGAANAMAPARAGAARTRRAHGVSAGNMAQGVAWCARELRHPLHRRSRPRRRPQPRSPPSSAWAGASSRSRSSAGGRPSRIARYPGRRGRRSSTPFDDPHVMAGNGTIGLEILEDLPDVDAIVVPWGGGGPHLRHRGAPCARCGRSARVFAAEVETAAPLAAALPPAEPRRRLPAVVRGRDRQQDRLPADARTRPRAHRRCPGRDARRGRQSAVRLLAERNRVIAEGAGACPVAARSRAARERAPIACIVSGRQHRPRPLRVARRPARR